MDAEQDIGIAWRGRPQLIDGHTDKRLTGNGDAGDNPDDWSRRAGKINSWGLGDDGQAT